MKSAPRYRLVRTIASGGMAQVYEAVSVGERGFERRVAIKRVLPEHVHDEAMRRMFLDEARIAAHLHHGGIVQVLDYGTIDGAEFIAMEYVDGIDALRATKRALRVGAPITEALAMYVVAEVARALEYAHERTDEDGAPLQIVHRDVSPQNILLSWDGDVKLSDFGIAVATAREEKTATGVVKGKLGYMPPEQAAGQRVTPATDVYGLGATLHALLAGGVPENALTRREGEPLEIDPELSEDVAEVVRAAMEWAPEDRPETRAFAFRCGQLAARLMDRDARGALSDWLAKVREAPSRKASALDDLMGLALVAHGDGTFTVAKTDAATDIGMLATEVAPARQHATGPTSAEASAEDEAALATRVSQPVSLPIRSRRLGVLVGVVAFLSVGGLVAYLVAAGPRDATARSDSTEVDAGQPIAALEPDARAEEPTPVDAAGAADAAPAAPDAGRRAEPPARPPPPTQMSDLPREPTTVPEDDEPTDVTGYVRIPRVSATSQERVVVDGRPRGFTPVILSLPSGAHRIEIVDVESGELVTSRQVVVEGHHTRIAPLVLPR